MNKIEELENKMLEIAQEIAELKKGQNAGEWKPQLGEDYWFINDAGEKIRAKWTDHNIDHWRIKNIQLFATIEECRKYVDYRKALNGQSYKFSEAEWNDGLSDKYYIEYNHIEGKFRVDSNQFRNDVGKIYFKTREDAHFMIDNYSEEMLKWGLL